MCPMWDLDLGESPVLRGTVKHGKMGHLAALLGAEGMPCAGLPDALRQSLAVGIMESLWHFCAQFTPRGDLGAREDGEIAAFVGWPVSEAGRLLGALFEARWLDRHEACRFVPHQWAQHCDSAVHAFLFRRGWTFVTGEVPKDSRVPVRERKKIAAARRRGSGAPDLAAEFEAFWKVNADDKLRARKKAFEKYAAARQSGVTAATLLAGMTRYRDYIAATGEWAAMASTWLNQGRWDEAFAVPGAAAGSVKGGVAPAKGAAPVLEELIEHEPTEDQIRAALG